MKKHFLIIGGMRFIHKKIQEFADVDITFICTKNKIKPIDFLHYTRTLCLSDNLNEWLYTIKAINSIQKIDNVLCFDDQEQMRVAIISNQLNLPFHKLETIKKIRDKYLMRDILRKVGLENIQSASIDSVQDIYKFISGVGFPIILKPRSGLGSIGVEKIESFEEIESAYRRSTIEMGNTALVAEQFITGQEYSAEIFCEKGEYLILSTTHKFKNPTTFVEQGHFCPANLTEKETRLVSETIPKILKALNIENGACHTEFIISSDGIHIVETHLRVAGDLIPEMVLAVTGIDEIEYLARQSLGEAVLPKIKEKLITNNKHPQKYSSVWFFDKNADGIITRIDGIEEARMMDGIIRVVQFLDIGSRIRKIQQSDDRIFAIQSISDSPDSALKLAQIATEKIDVYVDLVNNDE